MGDLNGRKVLITGGSRGIGLAIAKALMARGASVTVLARDQLHLAKVKALGASTVAGDATDSALMDNLVGGIQPSILILNAGATPKMGTIEEQTFESFSVVWNTDVKASLHGVQAALKTPLPAGSRVLLVSSGAAMVLSLPQIRPESMKLSGGYIGAKRVIWLMAHNANRAAKDRELGIHFQVILPLQLIGDTDLGQTVASAYALHHNTTVEEHLLSRYGKTLQSVQVGNDVAEILTNSQYETGVAYGLRCDTAIMPLDV